MATKAKPAAKAAPVEAESPAFEVGQTVRFLGYAEGTPEDEQALTEGEEYEIAALTEDDDSGSGGGHPLIHLENPDFNPKKKEHAQTNPKIMEVEVLPEEVELVEDEVEDEVEVEVEAEVEAEEEAPAPAPKAAAKKTVTAKAAPAKTAGKAGKAGKAAAKSPAKKKVAEPKPAPEPVDETPDLENEDEEVLALIEGSDNLIELAQQLEQTAAASEWQLGGTLYHLKKSKAYEEIEGGEEYKLPGGFQKFLIEYFNIEYRKAMWLIEIYRNFTIMGIENPAQEVAAMGWTKAKTIAKPMMEEGANAAELIELAKSHTVSDLTEAIKEQVTVGATKTGGTRVTRITLKFRLLGEDAAAAEGILKAASEQFGHKELSETFLYILNDWASEHAGGTAKKAVAPKATAPAKKVASKRVAA